MSDNFSCAVFLSLNSKGEPRVRRLAERPERAELRVRFDEWIIKRGDISESVVIGVWRPIAPGQRVSRHLEELGVPEPELPPFDESKFEPMPDVELNPKDEFWVDPDKLDSL